MCMYSDLCWIDTSYRYYLVWRPEGLEVPCGPIHEMKLHGCKAFQLFIVYKIMYGFGTNFEERNMGMNSCFINLNDVMI